MAFALLAALAFAASPRFELEHAMLAALALTLAVGIKYQTLVPSFIVALIVLVRIWLPQGFRGSPAGSRHRTPVATKAGVTLLGAGSILGFGATTYLRNYWVFKNPFWPFLIPSHKEWPGYLEKGQDLTKAGVDINIPYEEAFRSLFISQYANLNYGFGFVWVILPLFALASVVYLWSVLGCVARWGRARRGVHGTDWSALLLVFSTCLPAIAVVWTSPSLNQARYHDFVVGVMLALIAWMTGASRLGGLAGEGAIGAVTVISMMGYLDASPRFLLSPHELRALAAVPYPEREVDHDLGSIVFKDVGLAREHELGPGDIVAFGKNYGGFPSEFFNNRMSNRAIYLPDESTFLDDADAMGAKWIYCQSGSSCAYAAQQHGWAPIGELHSMQAGKVYHRIQSRN
jgi:hypothetical protein